MWWKNLSYERRGAIITTLIGILGWIIFFVLYPFGGGESGIAALFFFVTALISIIPLWLLGLLIGNIISKKKKSWYFYLSVIFGIILTLAIIIYFVISWTG